MRKTKITGKQIHGLRFKEIYEQELAANRRAKAGWFYDPEKEAKYRYWTGSKWSDHLSATLRHDHPVVEEETTESLWTKLKRATGRD